ncbi:aminoglycoside 6-adenylyltransferase [Lysinibacillus sp. NPDC093692]
MRTEKEIKELILKVAEKNERVRAVAMSNLNTC